MPGAWDFFGAWKLRFGASDFGFLFDSRFRRWQGVGSI
jgi:hypothetical protein